MEGARKKRHTPVPAVVHADPEARRRAAAVLEVMGGLRTAPEAAKALEVSLPRYYSLEKRALEGLVSACAPSRRKGRQPTPEKEMDRLRAQIRRVEREASANLALARAARLTGGLGVPASAAKGKENGKGKEDGKKRRKRRPTARALLAAEALRGQAGDGAAIPPARHDSAPEGGDAPATPPMGVSG